jgi:putative FmdB family regulatory protein
MPIYLYECPICKLKANQRRSIADMEKEEACPDDNCSGKLKKLLTVGSVIRSPNVPR